MTVPVGRPVHAGEGRTVERRDAVLAWMRERGDPSPSIERALGRPEEYACEHHWQTLCRRLGIWLAMDGEGWRVVTPNRAPARTTAREGEERR